MDIITWFKYIDTSLFFVINNLPHTKIVDEFFLFFSFYPPIIWLAIGMIVILLEEKKDKEFIFRLFIALFLAGALTSGLIKPIVKRPRPDIRHGEKVVIVTEKPALIFWNNDYAFPSGHAAIAFAGAYVLTREEFRKSKRNRKIGNWIFYLLAFITAISRIYLGKHYPLDVVGGSLLGWFIGFGSWKLVDLVKPKEAR